MSAILAIDTGSDFLGVALWNGLPIFELNAHVPRRHSELLPEFVDVALKNSAITTSDIANVALAIGPGSYTGLRIGVAFVQGFCFANGCKAIAVDSLLAQAGRFQSSEIPVGTIVDARAGKVYGGVFDVRGVPFPIIDSDLWDIRDFAAELSSRRRMLLCGSGADKFFHKLNEMTRGTELIVPSDFIRPSAMVVAMLAAKKVARGEETIAPEMLEPKYMREFTPGKRKRKPLL